MTSSVPTRPRVFFDVQSGADFFGRIFIELFSDKTPKTCENFRAICTSSFTAAEASEPLSYKNSPFHRIIDEFMIQGGDITAGNGTGGKSIYGDNFEDENIGWRDIDAAGLVCMANRGKDTNSSQFFITLAACEHLNAKHTIFGHVVKGMDLAAIALTFTKTIQVAAPEKETYGSPKVAKAADFRKVKGGMIDEEIAMSGATIGDGRLGDGDAGEEEPGIKFKGRGSMKYREPKW
ncbi:MAG: hypothetical protein Q9222_003508 [Ikaeria aurantiellina]